VTLHVVIKLRQACSTCHSWSVSYNSMGCSMTLSHESLSMIKRDTCVGTVMASFKGCSIWPQLVGAADSAGRLPRKASKCGRTDDRVCSSAVRLTKAPRRCSRMSLMRDRSALTPSQSASILLACIKYQVHKSAYVSCKPVVVYVHYVRSVISQFTFCVFRTHQRSQQTMPMKSLNAEFE